MAIESEIKFTVKDRTLFECVAALDEIAGYRTEDRGIATHTDTYFDTADFQLYREKYIFRLRTKESCSVLTFKACAPSGEGFYRRIEIEEKTVITADDVVQGYLPDLPPVRELYDRAGIVSLSRSLEITNNRHIILLISDGEPLFEVVLDDVTFCGPNGTAGVLELEVESLTGACDDLSRIGRWLSDRFDLKAAGPSKYILGMEFVGGV